MGGSILDQAYEEKRNAELDAELDDLEADYRRRNPPETAAVVTPAETPEPEEEVDLWTEAPDRPQRISKKSGGPNTPVEAFARDIMSVPGTVVETAPALIPGWQKLWHDSQAFMLENPNGLPRDWQLMSDESEDYFSQFPQPDAGEVTGAAPFRSAEDSKAVNKAVKTAQLRATVQEARLRVALPTSDNKFQQGVIDTTFNLGMMAPSMVAGIVTKNAPLAVSLMSSQTGMGAYGDARRAGAEPGKAYRYGLTMATIEGLTEFMPTKLLIGDMIAKTEFVDAFTKQMIADGVGEQAATHLQDLTTWLELNPDKTLDEFLAERPAATIRTAIASAMTSTLLSGGTTALSRITEPKATPEGEAPAPAAPAATEAAPAPEPAPTPEAAPAAADAPAGEEGAQTPEQAQLLETVNKVADAIDIAQTQERKPIAPQQESEDQRFVRGVESALGIKRPPAPVETPEERRTRMAERDAAEQRTLQDSTQRIVAAVRSFAETRAAAEQTVEQAVEAPTPENVAAAVDAHNELAEQTGAEVIDPGPDMTLATVTPEERAVLLEKVAEAVEAAPLPPEDDASATLVEEVRATAPASRYFGRKSFGGEGLATEMPAAEAAPLAPAAAPQPARLPAKPAPISDTQLAAITAKEGKLSRPVQAREAMLLKAEDVYDDVLTKDVLTALDDQFDMSERQIREVMGKAIEGRGSLDRFNTLMKRYAKVRAGLDREAAQAVAQAAPEPVAAPATQEAPAAVPERVKRMVEGETWASLWKRVQRFSGREDAAQRYDDAAEDAAVKIATMSPRMAEETLSDARQLGGPAEKAAVDDIRQRVERIRNQPEVKFSGNEFYNSQEDKDYYHADIVNGAEELLGYVTELEAAIKAPILESNQATGVSEPLTVVKEKLAEIAANKSARGRAVERQIFEIEVAIKTAFDRAVAAGQLPAFAQAEIEQGRQMAIKTADAKGFEGEVRESYIREMEALSTRWAGQMSISDSPDEAFSNYGLLDYDDQDGAAEQWRESADDLRQKANELGLTDVVAKIDAIGEFDQAAMFGDVNTNIQALATVRRNLDELADEVFARARAAEDVNSPEWQTILDKLRSMVEQFESEDGLRRFSRPRNVLFSGAGNSKRKPVADPEKNRKRLDARAYRDWGQNYLDLVQKGMVTFASAEEIEAMGFPGGVNAVTIGGPNAETIINTSLVKPNDIEGILLHEVGVHRGLKGLMGEARLEEVLRSLDALVDSFAQKMQQGLKPSRAEMAAKSARIRAQKNAARPEQVREETLAYMVEEHATNPFMPPFLTQLKVAIGRRFPGIIDRLGWGSAEYAQLALVSLQRFIIKEIKHVPNDRGQPGYRSPRAPYLLQVTYPEGFRKLAREFGSATTPQGWARRTMAMGQMQMWRMIRTLDLRNVDSFPQQLKDMERDLTSPEVFEAFFGLDPNFEWENYLDLLYLSQQGDPDAAFDLTEILTQLKGLDVPVEVKFSADGIVNDLPGSALWEASRAKGLDMSADARRARGTAAGFNMEETLYHGTGADFTVFDLDRSGDSAGTPGERAVFLSANPTEASVYARNAAVANNGPGAFGQGANIRGANVMPMVIRPGRQMVVTTQSHPDLKSQDGKVMLYNASRFAEIIADARSQGYNTVRFENVLDSALDPADQIAVLDPKDIRSVNAVFDPKNAVSAQVMFSADFADPAPDVDPALEEVYFNFVRFGDPDMVYPTIKEALKSAAVKERMGPAMVLSQVEKEVEQGNVNAFEAMMKSRKGGTLTPVEMTALRNMHKYSALKLKELADMANADPGDKSLEAAVMRAAMFHQALLSEVKGQSAAASRMLNAMKIQAKATPAIATAVDTMLGDANSTGDLRRMIRDLAQMDPSQIKNLNKRVEMSTWKAWQDLAGTWLRAMYLSMPSTHIVNALGNVTTMLGSIADHHVAGRLTMDPDLVEEAMVRYNAMVEGFVHQFTYMKANSQLNPFKPDTSIKFDQEGVSGADRWEGGNDRAMSAARLEKLSGGIVKASPDDPVGKLAELLGYALAAPSEALGVADDLFKGTNYRMSLRGQAFRAAREERRNGKITDAQEAARAEELFQWPTEGMVKQAIFEAQENTFTRPVGDWTKKAMSARAGLNRITGVMGWLLMPFILTPSNLMSFRFRRMPTAPLFEEWRSAYSKGGKDRAVAIAQVVNGTNLLMLGGALFGAGLMTGAGPDDPSKRKALMDMGWKPFAMNVNGTYVETNRLDPLMMPLHIAAAMAEVFANDGWNTDPNDDPFELMGMSALKFGQMMTDKTYMAGLANVFEAMQGGRGTSAIGNWFNRAVAGATTPALLAGVRRMEDPFKRQAFDIIDQIRNRVPVLSEGLPKAYDVFGNEVMYQEGFMSAFQLFNPFAVSKGRDEPIYQELMRLKYTPEPMDWSLDVPYAGNSVNVSIRERPDIYSEMTALIGGDAEAGLPNFREKLNELVQSDGYQQLSDINDPSIKGSKAKAISDLLEDARRVSRKVIIYDRYWPDLQDLAKKEFAGEVELGKAKEAEAQQSMVTQAYEALLEEAK